MSRAFGYYIDQAYLLFISIVLVIGFSLQCYRGYIRAQYLAVLRRRQQRLIQDGQSTFRTLHKHPSVSVATTPARTTALPPPFTTSLASSSSSGTVPGARTQARPRPIATSTPEDDVDLGSPTLSTPSPVVVDETVAAATFIPDLHRASTSKKLRGHRRDVSLSRTPPPRLSSAASWRTSTRRVSTDESTGAMTPPLRLSTTTSSTHTITQTGAAASSWKKHSYHPSSSHARQLQQAHKKREMRATDSKKTWIRRAGLLASTTMFVLALDPASFNGILPAPVNVLMANYVTAGIITIGGLIVLITCEISYSVIFRTTPSYLRFVVHVGVVLTYIAATLDVGLRAAFYSVRPEMQGFYLFYLAFIEVLVVSLFDAAYLRMRPAFKQGIAHSFNSPNIRSTFRRLTNFLIVINIIVFLSCLAQTAVGVARQGMEDGSVWFEAHEDKFDWDVNVFVYLQSLALSAFLWYSWVGPPQPPTSDDKAMARV